MSKSIRDQLLGLGLKPAKPQGKPPAKTHKPRPALPKASKAAPSKPKPISAKQAAAQQILERQLLNQQLQAVLTQHGASAPDGEQKFSYSYAGKIRNIYVSEAQRQQIIAGELSITIFKAKSILIKPAAILPILAIDPARFIYTASQSAEDDDPDHAVPDDLMW